MFRIGMRGLTGPRFVRPDNATSLSRQPKVIFMRTPPSTITGAAQNRLDSLRGAYHFFRCNVDPKKQATKFIDYVKSMNDNGELPPVLDLELNDGQTKDKIFHASNLDRSGRSGIWQEAHHLFRSVFPAGLSLARLAVGPRPGQRIIRCGWRSILIAMWKVPSPSATRLVQVDFLAV